MESSRIIRVALNIEQLMQRPSGGIGRYAAELARLLPGGRAQSDGSDSPDGSDGPDDVVTLLPFVACHRRAAVREAMRTFGLGDVSPIRLPLPRVALYESWNTLGTASPRMLSRRLRAVDLVHAPSLAVPPKGDAALVVTVHDAAPLLFPETYTKFGRRFHQHGLAAAARRADVVIAPSRAAADELAMRAAMPPEHIRVVPHGVAQVTADDAAVASARAATGIAAFPYILWVGTLEPRKNVGVLVEGFRQFVERLDPPHRLLLVASRGWLHTEDEIRTAAAALGDRVRITGPVDDDQLVALYRGADLFAFPSIHEGFGLPVLEAMSQGTAVVCSDIAVLREVAAGAARYVDAGDPHAWALALAALFEGDTERRALGAAGKERAAMFSWDQCANRTLAVYREILHR
jgi:glycosyltransferase involved in cell wall biosynthesis